MTEVYEAEKGSNGMLKQRDFRMDNIRFILINLVVFGHLLETFSGDEKDIIYKTFYVFHMPFFIFITGYFAKYNPRKIMRHLVMPYFVFQILYQAFYYYFIERSETLLFQFTTPYWLLWYLMTVIIFYLLLPMLETRSLRKAILIMLGSVILSLIANYDRTVGYYLSLSRTLTFMPFFVAGFYYKRFFEQWLKSYIIHHKKIIVLMSSVTLVVISEYIVIHMDLAPIILYGSYSYYTSESSWMIRLLIEVSAFAWIILGLMIIPNKKIPILTQIGQSTMAIFLMHGFLQMLIRKHDLLHYSQKMNLLLALVLTSMIVLFFSLKPVQHVFKKIF